MHTLYDTRIFIIRRYFICDKKLNSLGWIEKVGWEDGLKRTIDWFLQHTDGSYWENGDVEAALDPHPTVRLN